MTTTKQREWTVAEYHQMIETGILSPDERIELIEGKIIEMSPQGPPHATTTGCVSEYLTQLLGSRVAIRIQVPVTLQPKSEPESDIALVLPPQRRYRDHHPTASEIFLVIEIADSTLVGDCEIKKKMYAKAGISDYWVIDVKNNHLFVFRSPAGDVYLQEIELGRGDRVTPLAFPDVIVLIDELLP
ncbi:MAG: Uma2 family endonuclease [Nostocaceae cyanobacterium]|nr:Uma2 family endonuclease [Nostocaceae cyanobacterium]